MQKNKNIDDIKKARRWLYAMLGVVTCVYIWLSVSYIRLLIVEREGWLSLSNRTQFYNDTVYGDRGNIYDCQGRLVQASFPYYRVVMDLRVPFLRQKYLPPKSQRGAYTDTITNYEAYADSVCVAVSDYFKQYTHSELRKKMDKAFRDSVGTFKIVEGNITYKQLMALKSMPLFNQGSLHSGLIPNKYENRENLYGDLAFRVVGAVYGDRKNKSGQYARFGLEQYFDKELAGTPGIFEHRAGSFARPIRRPVDGLDLVMTIDMDIQDMCESLLENSFSQTHGTRACMIVMETATGEIKAMVNLKKDSLGGKIEQGENYCISEISQPGSTIKTVAMLAMLEDGRCDVNKKYFVDNGFAKVGGKEIKDTHHDSLYLSPEGILAESSNVGMSRIAIEEYGNNRKGWIKFYDAMQDMRFTHKIGLQLGEGDREYEPRVYNPETYKKWSLTTMPSMAYGYELSITPLYTLNFYNAIANNGYYVKPHIVRELRRGGEVERSFDPQVDHHRICSKKNLETIRKFLLAVVERPDGTGYYSVRNNQVKIAGKTGTARIISKNEGDPQFYQVTFVGYFPADAPKYSAIVLMVGNLYSEGAPRSCGTVVRELAKQLTIKQ